MTTLAVDKPRAYNLSGPDKRQEYPIIANDIIYEGAAVGENASGYARPLAAGDVFLGFALEKCDNTGGLAGDKRVKVRTAGIIDDLAVASLAITDNDRIAVYASDDDTFTKTASGNSLIGYTSRFVSTGVGCVEFDAALVRAALQA